MGMGTVLMPDPRDVHFTGEVFVGRGRKIDGLGSFTVAALGRGISEGKQREARN